MRANNPSDVSCHDVIKEEEVLEKLNDRYKSPNKPDTSESDGQMTVDFTTMRKKDAVMEHLDECNYEDHDLEELKNAFVTCKRTRYNKVISQEHVSDGLPPELDSSNDESLGKIYGESPNLLIVTQGSQRLQKSL